MLQNQTIFFPVWKHLAVGFPATGSLQPGVIGKEEDGGSEKNDNDPGTPSLSVSTLSRY